MFEEEQLRPEQRARAKIDRLLTEAGWLVRDLKDLNITEGRGIAVREFLTKTGPVDYLLYVDGKVIGTLEAKKEGVTLTSVEPQTDRYNEGFAALVREKAVPHWQLPLPFHYRSTGTETDFVDLRDADARPREVFAFHRPETLTRWIEDEFSILGRLRRMPELVAGGLYPVQAEAIQNLEHSLRDDKPRALIHMTMGSGKTYVAVAEAYRLLKHAGAERILFLVDRINLGWQAHGEFANYVTPDDGRKFTELYNVQVLRHNMIDLAAKVVITTIQRLYSILRGQQDDEFDPESEERSAWEIATPGSDDPLEVDYRGAVPIETFDFAFIDECHRSIYGRWGQVLDYFDMSLTGLTATAEHQTRIYFHQNVVTEYKHEQAVADGINVPYTTYRIKTEVTEGGGDVAAGEWVEIRDLRTRRRESYKLEDEITYDREKLDRAVVNPDQIRAVVRTFKEKVQTEIFPGRDEVPKTVFFCKTDNHADDVLRIIREEFGRGAEFARKITYKTEGSSEVHIRHFRNDPAFRIAVSVDQIATGTDIRPLECLVFMRMVQSRTLFEQMKGRGVRTIAPTELQAVSEGALSKERFVIVDCVGVTDEGRAWVDTKPLERKPSAPLKSLLDDIAKGIKDEATVSSVGARLARLAKGLDERGREDFEEVADSSLETVASGLLDAVDPDQWALEAAREADAAEDETYEPSDDELEQARDRLIMEAVKPLMDSKVRGEIESLRNRHRQIIDMTTEDKVLFAGWSDEDGQPEDAVQTFQEWVKEHHNEFVALKAYYEKPYRLRPSYADLKELSEAIAKPPLNLTPAKLWAAYEKVDANKVKGAGARRTLTDLVQLIRFAVGNENELLPRREVVMLRFDLWLQEQIGAGKKFTPEQLRWLRWMAEQIASSMSLERDDFDYEPFAQEGGLLGAHETFGDELDSLIEELNKELAAA